MLIQSFLIIICLAKKSKNLSNITKKKLNVSSEYFYSSSFILNTVIIRSPPWSLLAFEPLQNQNWLCGRPSVPSSPLGSCWRAVRLPSNSPHAEKTLTALMWSSQTIQIHRYTHHYVPCCAREHEHYYMLSKQWKNQVWEKINYNAMIDNAVNSNILI